MKVRSEIPTAENTTNMDGFGTCEVGTTLENLKAAIGGETGASAKYAAFAQAAKEQGYEQIRCRADPHRPRVRARRRSRARLREAGRP